MLSSTPPLRNSLVLLTQIGFPTCAIAIPLPELPSFLLAEPSCGVLASNQLFQLAPPKTNFLLPLTLVNCSLHMFGFSQTWHFINSTHHHLQGQLWSIPNCTCTSAN